MWFTGLPHLKERKLRRLIKTIGKIFLISQSVLIENFLCLFQPFSLPLKTLSKNLGTLPALPEVFPITKANQLD